MAAKRARGADRRTTDTKRARTHSEQRDVKLTAAVASMVCEFCGKVFKARGLKIHQKHCGSKRPRATSYKFCINDNSLAIVLSFLGNQSIVKLQSVTGARYPGSDALVSSICCRCENDELAIANGLCLACNRSKDPEFRETITTTEARKLYGIQDIDAVPHETHRVYQRGYYCLFKYEDLNQYAQVVLGSKRAW